MYNTIKGEQKFNVKNKSNFSEHERRISKYFVVGLKRYKGDRLTKGFRSYFRDFVVTSGTKVQQIPTLRK